VGGAFNRKLRLIVVIAVGTSLMAAAPAAGDLPDNDIVAKPVGVKQEDTTVVGSRTPTIMMQFNFGSTSNVYVMCSADLGAFTSCGQQITSGCPVSQCWQFQPTFSTDGDHRVDGAIFDSTLPMNDPNQPMDEIGFPIHIDSTLPDTTLTSVRPSFDFDHKGHGTIPVSFAFKTVDDSDQILYEDTAQCALTTGSAAPTVWGNCSRQRVPLSTQIFRFWARSVDVLHRPDPTPAESPPFSAVACRSQLLTHPHSLPQIARHGLRVRVHCIQSSGYELVLEMPLRETINLNRHHRDITSQVVAQKSGRVQTEGGSQVLTIHLLRGIPKDLLDAPRLSLELHTNAGAAASVLKRVTGF
jgi:hypothetical protein